MKPINKELVAKALLNVSGILAKASEVRKAAEEPGSLFADAFKDSDEILSSMGYMAEDVTHFSGNKPFVLKAGNSEWHGFDSESDALDSIKKQLEEHPEKFDPDFLFEYFDEKKAEDHFRKYYHGTEFDRVTELPGTVSKHGYENGLVDELVNAGLVSRENAKDIGDGKDMIEKCVKQLVDEKINEGEGGMTHYRFTWGDDSAEYSLVNGRLFDTDAAAKTLLKKAVTTNDSRWFKMS